MATSFAMSYIFARYNLFVQIIRNFTTAQYEIKNSWMRDPRCKHVYLDKPQLLAKKEMVTKVTKMYKREIIEKFQMEHPVGKLFKRR